MKEVGKMYVLKNVLHMQVSGSKKDGILTDKDELEARVIDAIERAKQADGKFDEMIWEKGTFWKVYRVTKNENGRISVAAYVPIVEYEPKLPEEVPKRKLNRLLKAAGLSS